MKFDITAMRDSSVLSLYEMRDRMNFEPVYQRPGGLWSTFKRQLLIDSLLNRFDIAKFYLHNAPEQGGPFDFSIIDGRQRFDTIWRFMEDRFALAPEFTFIEDATVRAGGMKYSDLAREYPKLINRLHSRVLDIAVVYTSDQDLVEDMFSRLNEAVPLNSAERRNAFGGPIPLLLREITQDRFFTVCIPISNTRYRHADIAAKMLYLEDNAEFVDTKRTSLDLFVRNFRERDPRDADILGIATKDVISRMVRTFEEKDSLLSASSTIPVYYSLFSRILKEGGNPVIPRRAFVEFEAKRKLNREFFELEDLKQLDLRLLEYDELTQNSNDSSAIRQRYRILREFLGI